MSKLRYAGNEMKHYRVTYSDTVYAQSKPEAKAKFKEVFREFEIEELWWKDGPFRVSEIP